MVGIERKKGETERVECGSWSILKMSFKQKVELDLWSNLRPQNHFPFTECEVKSGSPDQVIFSRLAVFQDDSWLLLPVKCHLS